MSSELKITANLKLVRQHMHFPVRFKLQILFRFANTCHRRCLSRTTLGTNVKLQFLLEFAVRLAINQYESHWRSAARDSIGGKYADVGAASPSVVTAHRLRRRTLRHQYIQIGMPNCVHPRNNIFRKKIGTPSISPKTPT